ncbi:MAG: hypothetical protein D6725_15790 [Planctomycetota bacterium]|nr:MAG: hypothetical protein D6725_15790 [Planctomycetota bacterium]
MRPGSSPRPNRKDTIAMKHEMVMPPCRIVTCWLALGLIAAVCGVGCQLPENGRFARWSPPKRLRAMQQSRDPAGTTAENTYLRDPHTAPPESRTDGMTDIERPSSSEVTPRVHDSEDGWRRYSPAEPVGGSQRGPGNPTIGEPAPTGAGVIRDTSVSRSATRQSAETVSSIPEDEMRSTASVAVAGPQTLDAFGPSTTGASATVGTEPAGLPLRMPLPTTE